MIRIAIADDQPLFAESLKYVLEGASKKQIQVLGIAQNGKEAIKMVRDDEPDVILMDIRMPVMDGVEATKIIHSDYPQTRILILTTFDDDDLAITALSSGATGYVLKDVSAENLIAAIEAVAAGVFYFAPSVGMKLVHKIKADDKNPYHSTEFFIAEAISKWPQLTRREAEIVFYASRAFTNAQISNSLHISENTVKNHLASIYEKLKIHNRLQLITLVAPVLHNVKE